MNVRRTLLIAPLLLSSCFSLFTESDGLVGERRDAYVDPGAKAAYEKRYTEVLGRLVGTTTSPLPAGVAGVAQGITFPTSGKLVALFGDSTPSFDDPVGFAPLAFPASGLPAISWAPSPLKVSGVDLGRGNVPVEGLVAADKTYTFFATGWDAVTRRYVGSALAHTTTDLASLTLDFANTTSRFVHVSVVQEAGTAWIFGSGADFRRSPIYLAKVSADALGDRTKWSYFAQGAFVAEESAALPLVDHGCVGELSVRKHPRLGLFIMAYQCTVPRGVLVRLATSPAGPWSAAINVMDATIADGGAERTTHADPAIVGHDDGLSDSRERVAEAGAEYGPYLVPEWFDATKTPEKTFAIVYTMSTFNPYTVWLMRTVLGEPGTVAAPAAKGIGLPKAVIANGDFSGGLTGWTTTGSVRVYIGPDGKARLTTSGVTTIDSPTGTASQEFTIDATTSALEFLIHGGDASVKLLRGTEVVRQSWGHRSNDDSKVVWDLVDLRGEKVQIVIEDTLTNAPWGFVGATGFTLR